MVHLCGGVAGQAGAYISGPRLGRYNAPYTYSRRPSDTERSIKDDKHQGEEYLDEVDGYDKVVKKFLDNEWDLP